MGKEIINFKYIWLYQFNNMLKTNYKQMFYPRTEKYIELWDIYNDIYIKTQKIGLNIPNEMDYPLLENYFITNVSEYSFTEYYKDEFINFCNQMEKTIKIIDTFLMEVRQ